jgi:hypothetical protein
MTIPSQTAAVPLLWGRECVFVQGMGIRGELFPSCFVKLWVNPYGDGYPLTVCVCSLNPEG